MTATPNDWNNEILEDVAQLEAHARNGRAADVVLRRDLLSRQHVELVDDVAQLGVHRLETLDDIDTIAYDTEDLTAAAQKWLEKIGRA